MNEGWQRRLDFLLGKSKENQIGPYTVEEEDELERLTRDYLRNQGFQETANRLPWEEISDQAKKNPEVLFLRRLLKLGSDETLSGGAKKKPEGQDEYEGFIGGMRKYYNTFIGR